MTWLATALGIIGGLALFLALGRLAFRRLLLTRAVVGGIAAAFAPALLLAVAAGAPLGGALGRQAFRELGLPSTGDAFGVASGVAVVFAVILLAGGAIGLAIARAFACWTTSK
jgi:hypothetical protein